MKVSVKYRVYLLKKKTAKKPLTVFSRDVTAGTNHISDHVIRERTQSLRNVRNDSCLRVVSQIQMFKGEQLSKPNNNNSGF